MLGRPVEVSTYFLPQTICVGAIGLGIAEGFGASSGGNRPAVSGAGKQRTRKRNERALHGQAFESMWDSLKGSLIEGGLWLTILELFRWFRSSQGFHTLEISRSPILTKSTERRLGDATLNELAFDGTIDACLVEKAIGNSG